MKKLLLVIITGLSLFIGASFADNIQATLQPATQTAISGSAISLQLQITNTTGVVCTVDAITLYHAGINLTYMSLIPLGPQVGGITSWLPFLPATYIMQLPAAHTGTINITGIVLPMTWTSLDITGDVVYTCSGALQTTKTMTGIHILPIADLQIHKSLQGSLPYFSGDIVSYVISVKNIGSTGATNIQVQDTRPTSVLNLLTTSIPYTSPFYTFALNDLLPGQQQDIIITGSLKGNILPGTAFNNTAKVVVTTSAQYNTGNDSALATGKVLSLADVYITKTMQTFTGYQAGSIVTYTITYGNSGGTAAQNVTIQDLVPASLYIPISTWTIGTLPAGSGGTIIFTGSLLTALQAGDTIVNKATIATTNIESVTGNNAVTVTGTIAALPNITLDITANNLTRPQYDTTQYGASGPNIMILAVSGDLVQLTINYGNNGNTAANSGSISLAGLGGFVSYIPFNGTLGNLNIGQTGTIVITGIVGPQNYISFTPTATLTYNSTQTVSDTVKIQEPFVCGDGLITRTEPCDTAGQIGLTISGQVCENHGGFCVVVTKDIINTACLDYRFTLGSGHICSSVQFPIEEIGQCKELVVHGSNIILADEDDGDYVGDANFTCNAQNGIASTIAIDCGNGEIHTGTNVSTLDATCHYNESHIPKNRTVQCYVDGTTQSGCQQNMIIDQAEFGRCGDGIIQGYEQCDEEGMEEDETINGCRNCHLVDEEVPPMACFSLGNTNISIQENEILPFRWKVDLMGSKLTDECGDEDDNGKIVRDSMKCEFRIFNGENPESGEGSNLGDYDAPAVETFIKDCDIDERVNDNGELNRLFTYFDDQKADNYTLLKHSGRYALDFSDVDLDGIYGEYNIALYKVRYNYCEGGEEKKGTPIDRVCETDFTVTKPYLAQKSSFGLTPKATTVNLDGYEDIFGDPIIGWTDLDKIMVLDANTYKGGTNVNSLMTTFINKYSKLAIAVDKNKVPSLNKDGITSIKIVPQQKIYILEGTAGTTVTLNPDLVSDTPFTIVTRNINLIVEGDLTTNGMFLVDNGTISFQETDAERCKDTQRVQGIFITNKGFAADTEGLSNDSMNKTRCNFGGLAIKGVLIGSNIQDLVDSRRSQLNHWFYAGRSTDAAVLAERRNEIFKGASVLIEYSPSLRTALPPGAGEFTKALDVYKK